MYDQELRKYLNFHEGLTQKVQQLLKVLLQDVEIIHNLESRTKEFNSLKEKIKR